MHRKLQFFPVHLYSFIQISLSGVADAAFFALLFSYKCDKFILMTVMDDLLYTESHEWIQIDGLRASVGITDYAQDSLGEIVYVELPEIGTELLKGNESANIESSKVAKAIYSPLDGRVVARSEELNDNPVILNKSPYAVPLFVLELSDNSRTTHCLNAEEYRSRIA